MKHLLTLILLVVSTHVYAGVGVTPNSGTAGSNFKFYAQLTSNSPSGWVWKIQIGDGGGGYLSAKTMSGSGTYFYYNATISQPGSNRKYRISAFENGSQMGGWQNGTYSVTSAATAPTFNSGVAISDISGGFRLAWNSASGSGVTYKLYRSTSSGSLGSQIYSGSSTSYNNTGLSSGTRYYYTAKACNSTGCTTGSNDYKTYAPVTAPTFNSGVAISDINGGFRLAWNNASGSGITYKLYRSTSSSSLGSQIYSGNSTSYNNTGLSSGIRYYYTAKACNSTGCTTGSNDYKTYAPATAPTFNSGVAISDISGGFRLAWNNASGSGITYKLYRSTSSGSLGSQIYSGSSTSYNNTGLSSGSRYYYTAKACNITGCTTGSKDSKIYEVVIQGDIPTIPSTGIGVNPNPGTTGSNFKFYAQLTDNLPSGWEWKIQIGDGSGGYLSAKTMSGSGKYFYYNATINQPGNRKYRIGAFNNGSQIGGWQNGTYTVNAFVIQPPANSAPDIKVLKTSGLPIIAGTNFSATINFVDVDGNLDRAVIDWGEGVNKVHPLSGANNVKDFNHTYNKAGNYPFKLTVFDKKGLSKTIPYTFLVKTKKDEEPINTAPDINVLKTSGLPIIAGTNFSATINFTDAEGNLDKAIIDWGDGVKKEYPLSGSNQNIDLTHVYKETGSYPFKLTVFDIEGLNKPVSGNFTVENQGVENKIKILEVKVASVTGMQYSSYNFIAHLSKPLPTGYQVIMTFIDADNITLSMKCEQVNKCKRQYSPQTAGNNRPFKVEIKDTNGNIVDSRSATYTVRVDSTPPVLISIEDISETNRLINGIRTYKAGEQEVTLKIIATGKNVKYIEVDWRLKGDEKNSREIETYAATSGIPLVVSRMYPKSALKNFYDEKKGFSGVFIAPIAITHAENEDIKSNSESINKINIYNKDEFVAAQKSEEDLAPEKVDFKTFIKSCTPVYNEVDKELYLPCVRLIGTNDVKFYEARLKWRIEGNNVIFDLTKLDQLKTPKNVTLNRCLSTYDVNTKEVKAGCVASIQINHQSKNYKVVLKFKPLSGKFILEDVGDDGENEESLALKQAGIIDNKYEEALELKYSEKFVGKILITEALTKALFNVAEGIERGVLVDEILHLSGDIIGTVLDYNKFPITSKDISRILTPLKEKGGLQKGGSKDYLFIVTDLLIEGVKLYYESRFENDIGTQKGLTWMTDIVYNNIKAYITKDPIGLVMSNGGVLFDIGKENFKAAREYNAIKWDTNYSKAHGKIMLLASKYQSIYSRSTFNNKKINLFTFVSECNEYKTGTRNDYGLAYNSKIHTLCSNYERHIINFDKNIEGGINYFISIDDRLGFETYLKKYFPITHHSSYMKKYILAQN